MSNEPMKSTKKMDEIIIVDDNFDHFFSDYFQPRIPVVIKGGINHWPLMQKWNAQYISETFGDHVCTLVDDGRPAYSKMKSTLKQYFEEHDGVSTLTLSIFKLITSHASSKIFRFPIPYLVLTMHGVISSFMQLKTAVRYPTCTTMRSTCLSMVKSVGSFMMLEGNRALKGTTSCVDS